MWSAACLCSQPMNAGRSSREDGESIEVRGYEPADEARAIELLHAAFGRWPPGNEDPGEFFRWKMIECPFGPSISLVALSEGQVVGFLGQMRWQFRVRGQTVRATRGVDLAVGPSRRRRGVSSALVRRAMENPPQDTALAWNNPNNQSRPGLMKTKGRKLVLLPRFVQPHPTLRQTLSRVWGRGSGTPAQLAVEAESASAVLSDGEYVSQLCAKLVEPSDRLVTARDRDYLRWRYGRFGDYHAFRCDARAGAPGIVIFRLRRRGSLWVSYVSELLVAGDDLPAKRRLLGMVRHAADTDLLSASFSTPREALLCGFLPSRRVSLTVRQIGPDIGVDPTQSRAWALSLGDMEPALRAGTPTARTASPAGSLPAR